MGHSSTGWHPRTLDGGGERKRAALAHFVSQEEQPESSSPPSPPTGLRLRGTAMEMLAWRTRTVHAGQRLRRSEALRLSPSPRGRVTLPRGGGGGWPGPGRCRQPLQKPRGSGQSAGQGGSCLLCPFQGPWLLPGHARVTVRALDRLMPHLPAVPPAGPPRLPKPTPAHRGPGLALHRGPSVPLQPSSPRPFTPLPAVCCPSTVSSSFSKLHKRCFDQHRGMTRETQNDGNGKLGCSEKKNQSQDNLPAKRRPCRQWASSHRCVLWKSLGSTTWA